MMTRRRLFGLGAGAAAGMALTACGKGGVSAGSSYPARPVKIIIVYEAGGGTDVGARALQPYLEKALGQSVTIVNKPGGGGWLGWGELAQAKPDGYTIGMINTPNFMSGYLNPDLDIAHGLSSFTPIANHVTDYGVIAVSAKDDRFSDVKALVEHARKNRLTGTTTGVGSDDHISALALNEKYGTKFKAIHSDGASENVTAVLGGNVDVLFANVGEVVPLLKDKRLRPLAVLSDQKERSEFLPDVPTLSEAGFPGVYSWSSRGFAGPKGLPDDVTKALGDALRKAIQDRKSVKKLGKQGLLVDYQDAETYLTALREDEKRVKQLGSRYIW